MLPRANRIRRCCAAQAVQLPAGVVFFQLSQRYPRRDSWLFLPDPAMRQFGEGVARSLRGTVLIPLAGFSVSSVPLTCMVTIAHAIREGAPTVSMGGNCGVRDFVPARKPK